jgi:hypothetical protein
VFDDSAHEVVRHTDVKRSVSLAREDIDEAGFHLPFSSFVLDSRQTCENQQGGQAAFAGLTLLFGVGYV